MANNLTGGFDAVVQLAVRQINGVLATLHQNRASDDAPLKLLHKASLRVGDPVRPRPDLSAFGDWVAEYQSTRRAIDIGALRDKLTGSAPPGAARVFADVFDQLGEVFIPPAVIRGRAKTQLGSATLSVPAGSTSEVVVHVQVRAVFEPDPGTNQLPAPIHGEVQAAFDVHRTGTPRRRQLTITPSTQDAKIVFIAAPGRGL